MHKLKVHSILFILVVLSFLGCDLLKGPDKEIVGFDLNNIDTTISPKEDFYNFAVGNWIKNNPIPDDQIRWGAFDVLIEETNDQVKTIIDMSVERADQMNNTLSGKVGTFYKVGMDTVQIEELGVSPLEGEFEKINSLKSKEEVIKHIAYMHKYIGSPLFFFYSTVDAKNSDSVITGIWQGGLGLPDRDYYFNEDDRSKEIRERYVLHVQNMYELAGDTDNKKNAESIMKFEKRLAGASNTRLENRDPNSTYNKYTTSELVEKGLGFDWNFYFKEVELGDPIEVVVGQPKFITEFGKMIDEVALDDWKNYLRWNLLRSMSPYLSSDFVDERFDFYGNFLNGQKVIRPRWKRVQATTSSALGEAIGQLYVKKYFPPEAKEKAKQIVEALKVSMRETINAVEWMTQDTKEEALKKLSSFGVKIGYPDKWTDYTELKVSNDSYVKNVIASNYFDHTETLSKINQPVREWEWAMNPQRVNAYYSPTRNEIVFPAAILQFPFFTFNVDDAINYGAMGFVIGHEMTHGFDDRGRQYDADGNIRDWWTQEDNDKFKERVKKIIEQYDALEPIDSFFINGTLTQGENIADLGGLKVAYNAFRKTEQYKTGELIDGFSPSQRFYLSCAQVWKSSIRDEALKERLKTGVHSPAKFRVNGPLSNLPTFYEAFGIEEGDGMYRGEEERVLIW